MTASSRDPLLDGWRGVSVLAVLFGHALRFRFGPYFPAPAISEIVHDPGSRHLIFTYTANRFAEVCAATGVQIFFVISGFIITKLLLSEKAERGQISLPAFYIRRSFRILPPFMAYLAACFVFWRVDWISVSPNDFYSALTFTCNLQIWHYGWFVSQIWSLSIEEQFYLIWPLFVIVLPSHRRTGFLLTVLVALTTLTIIGLSQRNTVSFACIAAGALYACSASVQQLIERRASVWAAAAVAAVLLLSVYLHSIPILYRAIQAVLPMGILYVLFSARHLDSIRGKLETAVIGKIGLISYSLYLWQQLFLAWPTEYLKFVPPIWLLPIVATASYLLLERPMIAVGRRLSKRLQSRTQLDPKPLEFGGQAVHTT